VNSRQRGFSFTEILFAVVVLGIGFIMVAAIFPVAIQQSKLSGEQTSSTLIAHEALNYLQQVGANSDAIPNSQGGPLFPATGIAGSNAPPYYGLVFSFRDPQPNGAYGGQSALSQNLQPTNNPLITGSVAGRQTDELWNRLNLSLIVPSDPRYAFVGLYRRNGDPLDRRTWSPYVQAWFIPVTTRARTVYNPGATGGDIFGASGNQLNLQARLVKVSIDVDPTTGQSYPTLASNVPHYVLYNWVGPTWTTPRYQPQSLSENCYVIIANDQITYPPAVAPATKSPNFGRMAGHIYHVGLRRPDLDSAGASVANNSIFAYDLLPDGDFSPDPGANGYYDGATYIDDILTIGLAPNGTSNTPDKPFDTDSPRGNAASGPADAYVISLDDSGQTPDKGSSQDISAFSTFIKVN
jgi:prepilin-type N-terminal cleavage/methylation domain-containing protein